MAMDGRSLPALSIDGLLNLAASQRWFAGKARRIAAANIRAHLPLGGNDFAVVLDVSYADGGAETYFMPIVADGNEPRDALSEDRVCRRLLELISQQQALPSKSQAAICGVQSTLFDVLYQGDEGIKDVGAASREQSNSAITFGDRLFLKIFRKIEPGVNPDYEVARYLTEQTAFTRIPRVAGAIEFRPEVGPAMTLAVLQELVPNEGDAWQAMLQEVRKAFEIGKAQPARGAELLGQRTAELHLALLGPSDDPVFAPESLTIDDCEALAARLRRTAEKVFRTLGESNATFDPAIAVQVAVLLERGPKLVNEFSSLLSTAPNCTKTRIHGDYHLGQVLCQEDDFVILDFEGEPARSLAERRAKDSPLRDVAGMLRSFGYAAYAGLFEFTERSHEAFLRLEPVAKSWQEQSSEAFLRGYFAAAEGASFLPAEAKQLAALIDFFIVEKSLYEVLYELNHRPSWLRIPLAGILAIAK